MSAGAAVPAMPGLDTVPFLTNSGILELDRLPEHLLVVGGSYVGLEFARSAAASAAGSR
ncbi:MAG: FAD-dependent oxidoreductase [Dongiaceae bacterium]